MTTLSNSDYIILALRNLQVSIDKKEDNSWFGEVIGDPASLSSAYIDKLVEAVNFGQINVDIDIDDDQKMDNQESVLEASQSIDLNGANEYHILASVNGGEPRFYEMKADDPDMAIDKAHMNFKHLKGQDTTFEVDAVYVVGPRGDMIESDWEADTRMYMR